ncbi:DUF2628 domain-containing protein [Lacticaseibacillus pabuli]|uniref:DUF2628 domain-containing protein n=1 Tax=Lacticaseibacillus pabuli TaxID=3025672 RepID=A0ABY7WRG9_9LACO|nr:DUF2628 domain-containing protein [Lacticaseibacillus sp. KACC 23028]WDF81740.1 DUF2628 domain-containing protein [Lacticaseibacillus sp. KACC 23028]
MFVTLTNRATAAVVTTKVGFSWTTLFFGFFPALFRSDYKWALIIIAIELLTGTFTFGGGTFFTCLVFSFLYNRLYINDLLAKGYEPANETARDILRANNFAV